MSMLLSRRSLITAAAAAAVTSTGRAQSGPYPNRPLSLVVPYPAGGPSDAAARIFAEAIGKDVTQPVIVDNISGGTGLLGANKVLSAPADGYTFLHGSPNEVILAPLLNPSARYKPTDFKYVQPTTEATIVLLARNGLEAKNLDELIELSRKNKAPLSYATVGIDSLYHLMGDAMAKRTGADLLHVPYKGSAPAVQDVAGGQVDFAILPFQVIMEGMARQGRLKILTSFSRNLPPTLKNVPKIDASKLLPDFEYSIGAGYLLRKDVPVEMVDRLRAAVGHALRQPEVRSRLENEGRAVLQPFATQAAADEYQVAELTHYTKLLKEAGRQAAR